MSLRHAGSPVTAPEKLSRGQQTALLLPAVIACRIVCRQRRIPITETHEEMLASIRASLRLDDPVLDDLIAAKKSSGQPWGPWQSTTYERI